MKRLRWRWKDSREVDPCEKRKTGQDDPSLGHVLALVGVDADIRGVLNADQVVSLGLPDGLHSVMVQKPDAHGVCDIHEGLQGLQELPNETPIAVK